MLLVAFLGGITLGTDDFHRPGVIAKVAAACGALTSEFPWGRRPGLAHRLRVLRQQDPCFELANIWRECRPAVDELDELVTEHHGKALRHKRARARPQGAVTQYGWTLRRCIQNGSSALEFDFWDRAVE